MSSGFRIGKIFFVYICTKFEAVWVCIIEPRMRDMPAGSSCVAMVVVMTPPPPLTPR
jgi:hypothetical protein